MLPTPAHRPDRRPDLRAADAACPATKQRRPSRTGFTLIELLVVVAIIALLAAILLPSLTRARTAAQHVVCMSNMKQMMLGVMMYTEANNDRLPSSTGGISDTAAIQNGHASWFFALRDYFKLDPSQLARCPADRSVFWEQPDRATGYLRRTSHAANIFLSGRLMFYKYNDRYTLARRIEKPALVVFASELIETESVDPANGNFAVSDHFHPELWLLSPERKAAEQLALSRHNGRCNWAYLDAAVRTQPLDEVYKLAPGSRRGDMKFIYNRVQPDIAQ